MSEIPALLDLRSTWYHRWYFELRLEEEFLRSKRYRRSFSIISIRLPSSSMLSDHDRAKFDRLLIRTALFSLRPTDLPGILAPDELAVLLPETSRAGAASVASRLGEELGDYAPVIGLAAFPGDGRHLRGLLAHAQSREGGVFPQWR